MAIPLEKRKTILGITAKGTGKVDPKSHAALAIPKTYQQIITIGTNTLVQKLNDYPYIKRRNDILALGDSRGRSEKYPPEFLLHSTGGPGFFGNKFDEGFVRGGIVQSTAVALEDVGRIGNFIASGKGILWVLREQGLQMTNARPETRLFNPLTMLLNVGGQHLGLHLPRHGLNPFTEGDGRGILDFGYNTYSTVRDYANDGNRFGVVPLVAVPRVAPAQSKLQDMISEMFLGDKTLNISDSNNIFKSLLGKVLSTTGTNVSKYAPPRDRAAGGGGAEISTLSYLAATNATYGGFSLLGGGLHRATNTILESQSPKDLTASSPMLKSLIDAATNLVNAPSIGNALIGLTNSALNKIPVGLSPVIFGANVSTAISKIPTKVPGGTSFPIPNPDLLKVYKSLAYGELGQSSTMYISTDRETLAGPSENYAIYPKLARRKASTRQHLITSKFSDPGNPSGVSPDRTNATPPQGKIEGIKSPHDLVPLIFYDVKNDVSLVFRAVLSGITDTINPEWNEYNYVGNPQTYYTYKRTTRDFGFTFKVYTDTEQELRWNWMKIR